MATPPALLITVIQAPLTLAFSSRRSRLVVLFLLFSSCCCSFCALARLQPDETGNVETCSQLVFTGLNDAANESFLRQICSIFATEGTEVEEVVREPHKQTAQGMVGRAKVCFATVADAVSMCEQ
jgi:hypothetical protein